MKYVNAKAVLPYHLVEELQEYIHERTNDRSSQKFAFKQC